MSVTCRNVGEERGHEGGEEEYRQEGEDGGRRNKLGWGIMEDDRIKEIG